MKIAIVLALGLMLPLPVMAQDSAAGSNYIQGGAWTYPSLTDVYLNGGGLSADVTVDCAVLPTGHVADCFVNSLDPGDKAETENAVGAAYVQHAVLDPRSVDGGIQTGDRVRFEYMWHDLPRSDLADAASLPRMPINTRFSNSVWTYPTGPQMVNAYPQTALHDRVDGTVILYCAVHADGTVTGGCRTLVEVPQGYGFGDATVRLFEKYAHVNPASVADSIQEGDYRLFTYKWVMN